MRLEAISILPDFLEVLVSRVDDIARRTAKQLETVNTMANQLKAIDPPLSPG